ncbi:syntaxin/t-SNARE family protein [Actinidia rufa]|uniref:Syntaxin/t-SNARE family protein n=1 Tax=Actinidia rufa TaxID=165716 RepID=A0A7J0EBT8_9ERIC|nr:syntaxin/t-SNARE family protein [Actinidia rufa]
MSFEDLESGRPLTLYARQRQLQPWQNGNSQAVAAGVFQINTAVASFQRLVNSLGTPKDTVEFRQKLHKTRLNIGELVKETSAKLKQASETDQHTEVSASKKIADAKLAKDFQSVLREFQKAQRLAAERETAYAPFVPKEALSSRLAPICRSHLRSAPLQQFCPAIIEEREQGIKEIQQQIGEVNDIFKDLAVLVHEQGVMIDDISSNIENSHAATTQATSQLAKASKIQRSNSSLTCLLLLIFGIVLIIVIIVVAA